MKRILRKPMFVAISAFVLMSVITGGVAYGAAVVSKSLNASVNILGDEDAEFEFYSNSAATQTINEVDLPDVQPGNTSTFTVYVKNTGDSSITVSQGSSTIQSARGTLTLTFDGQAQRTLAPGAVSRVNGTLSVPGSAPEGPVNFTFAVNAASSGSTSPPPTGTALSGQQLFNANCLTCHSGPPNTSRTGSQLTSFISSHQTGNNLSAAEIAAIASLF